MVWAQLGLAAAGMLSNRQKGKENDRMRQREIDMANKESRDRWNAQQEMSAASTAAEMARLSGNVAAGRAALQSRQDSFGLTKEVEESEQEQRDKFAAALLDFGQANKKVALEDAKAMRSGRASKAARGSKVSGTGGRAGRMSSAFRSGARGAVSAGRATGAETTGMEAALTGYGADLDREFGLMGDLSAQGAVVGEGSRKKRELANLRLALGNQEQQALMDKASAGYARDMGAAKRLGVLPAPQTYSQKPDYGIWGTIGDAAQIGSIAYGAGAFTPKPSGYGYTYGQGSNYPNRYTGINPYSKPTHPGGL